MASSTSNSRSLCVTCNKKEAFSTCHQCRNDFCEDHINAHQQTPIKQIDDYLNEHNQLQQLIEQYLKQPDQHPLIEQINKWERQSIQKIQQAANEARTQILNVLSDHILCIQKSFEDLTMQLEQAKVDDKVLEIFLQESRETFDKLRNDILLPDTIKIRKDDDEIAFISKPMIIIVEPDDLFERVTGNARIEDDGQLIVHGQWSDHSSVRGKNEYSSGQHRLRFKIEELDPDKWAFFGIVSKYSTFDPVSIITPSAYGLAGQDGICLNGVYQNTNTMGYKSDMEISDKLELFIDCDRQLIRLINERTHSSYELNIDLDKCPFPWQILLGLCCSAGDRIRILPSTYKE